MKWLKNSKQQAIELAKLMKIEFGVTPENIDEKLRDLKKKFYKKSPCYRN